MGAGVVFQEQVADFWTCVNLWSKWFLKNKD